MRNKKKYFECPYGPRTFMVYVSATELLVMLI